MSLHSAVRNSVRVFGKVKPDIPIILLLLSGVSSNLYALPSFARQTGQKCAACHVNGAWPQLTPWGRFFKLSGYTAGSSLIDKEGVGHIPAGLFGQAGATWAKQANDAQGQPVITQNGSAQAYNFVGEVATKLTNFMGIFYEYQLNNQFPGWKGSSGPVDLRAVHFFHPLGQELLVGVDSNNGPTVQDVWNSSPSWSYPFYGSPQAPGGPASPMIASLAEQSGSIGVYALLNRHWYAELSTYHSATDFFRWMSAGISYKNGDANYLRGYNPYWRAYWTTEHGPQSFMVGTFGMHSKVYPDSAEPSGPANTFADYGFDSQYQYLAQSHKLTLRGSYIYENQNRRATFPLGLSSVPQGNLKALNLNGTYGLRNRWTFSSGYFLTHGNNDAALYGITDSSGNQLTSSPNTSGYVLEVDRSITQNVQLMVQYRGFLSFNGLTKNIDGLGRSPSDNNTIWLSVFYAF